MEFIVWALSVGLTVWISAVLFALGLFLLASPFVFTAWLVRRGRR